MTDAEKREKVMRGLEACNRQSYNGSDCQNCPYYDDEDAAELPFDKCNIQDMFDDALALLKEQEAVDPIFKQGDDGIFVWCCGSCGTYMYHIYEGIDKAKEYAKYCRCCGRKVKWDD